MNCTHVVGIASAGACCDFHLALVGLQTYALLSAFFLESRIGEMRLSLGTRLALEVLSSAAAPYARLLADLACCFQVKGAYQSQLL